MEIDFYILKKSILKCFHSNQMKYQKFRYFKLDLFFCKHTRPGFWGDTQEDHPLSLLHTDCLPFFIRKLLHNCTNQEGTVKDQKAGLDFCSHYMLSYSLRVLTFIRQEMQRKVLLSDSRLSIKCRVCIS